MRRFDSALRLNVHSHVLALDGVYVEGAGDADAGGLVFMALPAPSADEVVDVAHRTAKRVGARLEKRGRTLDRLCRYLARPPIAQERLTALADGRLRYDIGTSLARRPCAIDLRPLELLTRLAAMVPPPRFHMIRFHGVVSSHSSLRSRVVPTLRRRAA